VTGLRASLAVQAATPEKRRFYAVYAFGGRTATFVFGISIRNPCQTVRLKLLA
jgi:hypothetical protein